MSVFLHTYAKWIAAAVAAGIAFAKAVGWADDASWAQIAGFLASLGLGYILPSPLSGPPSDDPPGGTHIRTHLLFFLALAAGLVGSAGTARAQAGVAKTSLFGIAERNQMAREHHERLMALEAAARQQPQQPSQPAPQATGPQVHYHFWNGLGGLAGGGVSPQSNPPQQFLPPPQAPQQVLPGPALPQQALPGPAAPQQVLPAPQAPQQQMPEPRQPQQSLPGPSTPAPSGGLGAPVAPQQKPMPPAAATGIHRFSRYALAKPIK